MFLIKEKKKKNLTILPVTKPGNDGPLDPETLTKPVMVEG